VRDRKRERAREIERVARVHLVVALEGSRRREKESERESERIREREREKERERERERETERERERERERAARVHLVVAGEGTFARRVPKRRKIRLLLRRHGFGGDGHRLKLLNRKHLFDRLVDFAAYRYVKRQI